MKILFAIKDLNNSKGGAEKVLAIVASGMAKIGYDVSLMTYDKLGGESYYPLDPKVKRISLGIGNSQQRASVNETTARIKAIRRVLKVRQPDVVIPFMHSMFVPVALASIGLNIPVIASEHTVKAHYRGRPIQFILLMLSSFLVKEVTVLSSRVKESYPWLLRRKMVVMPNPVEPPVSHTAANVRTKHTILNVGRLDESKDQKTLIRAFSALVQQYPDWEVRIFGEGPLRPFLQNLINKLSLSDKIHLMGTTPNIGEEYLNADIFVMPSKYESFGLVTAEAMSYGLPVIGFKECPGTNELIKNNKNGLLISKYKKDRVRRLQYAMADLMVDEDKRIKLGQGAIKIIEKYHPDIIIKQWEHIIDKYA